MPKVHGLELITVLRDVFPRPAIIAISGTGSAQLAMAKALGAEATLSKPVDPDELLSVVTKAVAGAVRVGHIRPHPTTKDTPREATDD